MRRILAVVISAAAFIGLASPAWAAGTDTTQPREPLRQDAGNRDWPIKLACNATTVDDGPALHCSWSAYDGAAAYRVVVAARRRNTLVVHRRRVTVTEFTRKVPAAAYNVLVRAVDGDRRAIARSNRVRVLVPRPAS